MRRIDEYFVEQLFHDAICKYISQRRKPDKIHVTDLVHECLRFSYFLHKELPKWKMSEAISLWIGQVIHEFKLGLKYHEFEVEWNGIVGYVDEYDPDLGLVIEKKTCKELPRAPYEQHVKQVEYYYYLLKKNNYKVNDIFILYIDVANNDIRVFRVIPRDLLIIEKEILEKANLLKSFLEANTPPPPIATRFCRVCPFYVLCHIS